jgi:hypothetical protein
VRLLDADDAAPAGFPVTREYRSRRGSAKVSVFQVKLSCNHEPWYPYPEPVTGDTVLCLPCDRAATVVTMLRHMLAGDRRKERV